jgi:hypothetical protein
MKSDKRVREALTDQQQASCTWLLSGLRASLGVQLTEVFAHPTVSWKNKSEGVPAKW